MQSTCCNQHRLQWAALLIISCAALVHSSADGDALLHFAGNITNFDDVSRAQSFTGWQNGTSVCGWTGVVCDSSGSVVSLNMSGYGFVGRLPADLNQMTHLVNLTLSDNRLQGPLPEQWGWTPMLSLLRVIMLDNNPTLSSTLPSSWGSVGGFSSLQIMNLSSSNIKGSLPLTWGSNGAFPALVELDLGNNSVTGTLPSSWSGSNSFPELRALGLSNNSLKGPLPASWGSQAQAFPSLEVLEVSYNALNGTLPAGWCGSGFPSLQGLYLHGNELNGTFPSNWGSTDCFESLATLAVYNNSLSGTIPNSWGLSTSFASLEDIVLLPGNPGICGDVPGTLEAVQMSTVNHSRVLNATSFGSCAGGSNSNAPISKEANLTSTTFNVLIGLTPKTPRKTAGGYYAPPAPSPSDPIDPLPEPLQDSLTYPHLSRNSTPPTNPLPPTPAPAPAPLNAPMPAPAQPITPAPAPATPTKPIPAPAPAPRTSLTSLAPSPSRVSRASPPTQPPSLATALFPPLPVPVPAPAPGPSAIPAPAPAPMLAPAPAPLLVPAPAPLMAPAPAPLLVPAPAPLLAPAPAPLLAPAPAPLLVPAPAPLLAPAPAPSVIPAPAPAPLLAPAPAPHRVHAPAPGLALAPAPVLGPIPAPAPVPGQAPIPAPVPAPVPSRAPIPAPVPAPAAAAPGPDPTAVLVSTLPTLPNLGPDAVNLTVGLNLLGGSSLLPYTNKTRDILVAAFQKSVNNDGRVRLLMVQVPADSPAGSPTTVFSSTPARRLLQAQTPSNVTATFGYTTTPPIASNFTSSFNTSQFDQALNVQGLANISSILQGVDGLEAALGAPAMAPGLAASPAETPIPVPAPAQSKGLAPGAIAGIAVGAGIILALVLAGIFWFCCRHRRSRSQGKGTVKSHAFSSSVVAPVASALCFWRHTPMPKHLVASKAVDLSPAMVDPEEPPSAAPSFTVDPKLGSVSQLRRPSETGSQHEVTVYNHSPLEDPQAKGITVPLGSAAPPGSILTSEGELQALLAKKAGLPHNDSAASLPSNTSSAQGPGTPLAPSLARDAGSSSESKSDSGTSGASSTRPSIWLGPTGPPRPEKQILMKPASRTSQSIGTTPKRQASTSPALQRPSSSQRPSISPAPYRASSSNARLHRQGSSPAMQRSNSSAAMQRQGSSPGLNRQGNLATLLRQGSSPALQNALLQQASEKLRQGTASPALQQLISEASALPRGNSPSRPRRHDSSSSTAVPRGSSPTGQRPSSSAVLRRGSSPTGQRPNSSSSSAMTHGTSPAAHRPSADPHQHPSSSSRGPVPRHDSVAAAQRSTAPSAPPVVAAADFARHEGNLDRRATSGLLSHVAGEAGGRIERERLIALSRRARRALERELQASQQQRSRDPASNRGSSAQPQAGSSRDPSRPQEGARGPNRRAAQGEGATARQRELSDRALKILEELSTFGRQGPVPGTAQQASRDPRAQSRDAQPSRWSRPHPSHPSRAPSSDPPVQATLGNPHRTVTNPSRIGGSTAEAKPASRQASEPNSGSGTRASSRSHSRGQERGQAGVPNGANSSVRADGGTNGHAQELTSSSRQQS